MNTAGAREDRWRREHATWPHHEASAFVQAGGIRWHVQRMGQGPQLLLVHGTGASTHSWRDMLSILRGQYSIVAPDLPGHGFTDSVPAVRRSIRGMGEALSQLLVALNFNPDLVVGHSAGAVILAQMALNGGIAPRSLISVNGAFLPMAPGFYGLFSPLAKWMSSSSLLLRWLARQAESREGVVRILSGTGSRINPEGIDLYHRLVRDPAHLAGALGMMGSWDLGSFAKELPRLPVPLLLIVGGNDKTVPPAHAQGVKRKVPQARMMVLPGLGHLAHEEAPELVARIIASEWLVQQAIS